MASISNSAILEDSASAPRASWWRGPRFLVEVFDGADEALAALEAVQGGLVSTGFQTLNWLTVAYEELASAQRAMPRLVVVTERNSGEVAMILPLVVKKKRALRIARFADFGVMNHGAPILGPAKLTKDRSIRRAWRAVRRALREVDLIRLEKMPAEIGGRINPLVSRRGMTPSRRGAAVAVVRGSVDSYLAACGIEYAKPANKNAPLRRYEDAPRFARAVLPEEIARAYTVMDEQRSALDAKPDVSARREDPAHRQFYERLVMDGSDVGLGYLFTLQSGSEIIATVFGIQHDGTFSLLRVSSAGDGFNGIVPERLICVETMKYFVARGVRQFDFGPGQSDFKRSFGANEVPLYDLIVARDLIALPRATFHRLKGRARKNQRLRAFFQRLGALPGG